MFGKVPNTALWKRALPLLLPDALEAHILPVECEAAWIRDSRRFH
jgi:hypothetical protein